MTDMPMKPQVVTYELNKLLDEDAIVSSDSGTIATWAARYIEMRDDMQFSLSGTLATHGQRPAVQHRRGGRLSGPPGRLRRRRRRLHDADGRARDARQVQAARQGHRHQEQRARHDQVGADGPRRQPAVRRRAPADRLRRCRRDCGAAGFTIERPEDAAAMLRQALEHPGPAVIEAVVDPNEPPMPGQVTTEQALKFAEALVRGQKDAWKIIKTVVKDKVREVV